MTTTFVGQLVTAGGESIKSYLSTDPRDFWAPLKYRTWVAPGPEVRSRQAATIPLRPDHGMAPIGNITALERRPDGSVWAAGTVDRDIQPPSHEDTYLSVEARMDPGGTNVTIEGASVCAKSCTIGLRPTLFLRDGLDQFGKAEWRLAEWQRDLLKRARRYKPAGEPIVVEGAPAETESATAHRRAAGTLELRSASVVDITRPLREVDLLIVPHELPSRIYERDHTFDEVFSVGAFAGAERDPGRIKLNTAHRLEDVLGKATDIDPWSELGCIGRFRVTKTRAGDEALTMIADDLLTPSAGFTIPAGGDEWRGSTSRRIRKANLHHVALTADPAHDTAVLGLRDRHHALR